MVNGKFPYYMQWKAVMDITYNFTVVYRFGSEKLFTVNNRKLTFPEFPALQFDVFVEITMFLISFVH